MNVNLETSLDQLARSVHDDAVAERMTGQVQHMVAQIRRRRAARYTASGLVSMGTVAAVAVVGVQLAGRNATPGPVATQPDAPSVAGPGCGDAGPAAPVADETQMYLEGSAGPEVVAGDDVPVTVRLVNGGTETLSWASAAPIELAVVSNGLVVATASVPGNSGEFGPGDWWQSADPVTLVACGGDTPLDPGEYQMFGAVTLTLADGPRDLVAGPWPFTITEAATAPTTDPAADATERLNAILAAAPSVTDPFPACGSIVPSGDDPVLALDLALGERMYTPGETVTTVATVRTTAGRAVIANAPTAGALIVLTRDGVVVGRGYSNPGDVDILDLAADETVEVAATGQLSLCSIPQTDAAQDGLPAGMYQAYAVMEVMLKEVTDAGSGAYSITELIAVRSNPVDILVGLP